MSGDAARIRRPGLRLGDHRPVLRFVLVFGFLLIAFNAFFYLWFSKGQTFERYLTLNARASATPSRRLIRGIIVG